MANSTGDITTPWVPTQDPVQLKVLGKLGEEVNELGSAVCRSIIQGIDSTEPTSGKPNRIWVEQEIADVFANVEMVIKHLNLSREYIEARKQRKIEFLTNWLPKNNG